MDNQKNNHQDSWFDELLSAPELGQEIGADESAVSAAGLTSHEDAELDRIIREAKAMDEPVVHTPQVPAEGQFRDEDYRDAFGDHGEELDAVFEEDLPPEPEAPVHKKKEPPVRKGRPKPKKGYGLWGIPHLLATVVWLAIAIAIGVSLGHMIWVCAADVLAFGRESREVTVTINDGDNIDTIASKLHTAGLIEYPGMFKLYAKLAVDDGEIAPGTHTLNSLYDYHALVNAMSAHSSTREEVEVMIPEGYTCYQIFALLAEKGVCTIAELESYAAEGELDAYWFLEGVPRGDRYCLEGYLFPDTYRFYKGDDPENVLEKMLNNFDNRFTEVMQGMIEPLNNRMAAALSARGFNQSYIDEHKFTVREVVIIASMVEKETANDAESFKIASVIYNRLTNPGSYPFLNIDATIIYSLNGNIDPVTGKAKPLTTADLQNDTPYNTYTRKGLTPGPISNPGSASLVAALDPDDTDYYYYAYNRNSGSHKFSRTKAEHDNFVNSLN